MVDLTSYKPLAESLARRISLRYPRLDRWDVASWVWESIWRASEPTPLGGACYLYRPGKVTFEKWVVYLAYHRCSQAWANVQRAVRYRGVIAQLPDLAAETHYEDRRIVYVNQSPPCVTCGDPSGYVAPDRCKPWRLKGECRACYNLRRNKPTCSN